ncbi:cation diffusion facilitator family transporter [bacterium]|jgi:cation diffusion facilitator family transporter|nr:cation diffusion facilitator family transporter [bacterium]
MKSSRASEQSRVLITVLLINLSMFFVEAIYGWIAQSSALLADSLDMLGDAFVYGISLYTIGRSPKWAASVSLFKGGVMALFGVSVIVEAVYRFLSPSFPVAQTVGMVGFLAVIANFISAALLLRHRNDDINMRSTWLCSRNDVLANIGVIISAGLVSLTESKIPDLVVGLAIATLVLKSSLYVIQESLKSRRKSQTSKKIKTGLNKPT